MGQTFAAPLILLRCHYCSTHCHPKEFVNIGESALMCWNCRELHTQQVEAFDPPASCQGCNRSFQELAAAAVGEHVKMYPVWKDNCYQVLCERCEWDYVQKRKDLYGLTRFGWQRKLN
jgi:hypothetical protein